MTILSTSQDWYKSPKLTSLPSLVLTALYLAKFDMTILSTSQDWYKSPKLTSLPSLVFTALTLATFDR